MKLLSVVLPVYNRAYIIGNAIQSIIDQEYKDWELIIVDDGSADKTEESIKRFKDERIKYFKIEHQGSISKVRNYGNKKATGEIIVIQDSDDVSYPHRLRIIAEHFESHPETDMFYSSILVRWVDININVLVQKIRYAEAYDPKRLLKEQYIPHHAAYRREKLSQTPYRETIKIFDDQVLLTEWSLKKYIFNCTPDILYEYMMFSDSVMNTDKFIQDKRDDAKEMLRILKKDYGIIANFTLFEKDRKTGKFTHHENIE